MWVRVRDLGLGSGLGLGLLCGKVTLHETAFDASNSIRHPSKPRSIRLATLPHSLHSWKLLHRAERVLQSTCVKHDRANGSSTKAAACVPPSTESLSVAEAELQRILEAATNAGFSAPVSYTHEQTCVGCVLIIH